MPSWAYKLLFFLFPLFLYGSQDYSVRINVGKATLSDFSKIIIGQWKGHVKDLRNVTLDGGYKLSENYYDFPIDIYLKGNINYYNEAGTRDDNYGVATYIKAYYNIDFLSNRIRFGFGEGLSYTKDILYSEYYESKKEGDSNSKFLNYLDVSLDFDLGKLLHQEALYGTYIGWTLEHRSGIFGLINNVRRGGSNYNTFSIEKNF